ncbi:hypothetical protein D3C72_2184030 [compost metagenome]
MGVDGATQHSQCVGACGLVQRREAFGLVGKVLVEGAARHTGLSHDVGDGGVGIAFGRHGACHAFLQSGAVFGADWSGCEGGVLHCVHGL